MICGHDREHLKLGLEMCNFFGDDALAMAGDKQHPYAAAIRDGHDPAKLTAIIAELMRERGLWSRVDTWHEGAYSPEHGRVIRTRAHYVVIADDPANSEEHEERQCIGDICEHHAVDIDDATMPQARTFALALLDSPQATTQDIERMIGEL